jgi:hypothetical protein
VANRANEPPERDYQQEYYDDDLRNAVVSSFEFFFQHSAGLSPGVRHFERFPHLRLPSGVEVTPDFAVVFHDGSMLCGEIARLSKHEKSIESIRKQVANYYSLLEGPVAALPGGGHRTGPVGPVDVVILTPHDTQNAMCVRLAESLANEARSSNPVRRPSVIGYSYDNAKSKLVYNMMRLAGTPPIPSGDRSPSLTSYFEGDGQYDSISLPAAYYTDIVAAKRFMNDQPRPLYLATVLWQDVFPHFRTSGTNGTEILELSAQRISAEMQRRYGTGTSKMVRMGMDFLVQARLAVPKKLSWSVAHKEVAKGPDAEVHAELLHRFESRPKRRVTGTPEEIAAARKERKKRKAEEAAAASGQVSIDDLLREAAADTDE